jgi:hypothetical protein
MQAGDYDALVLECPNCVSSLAILREDTYNLLREEWQAAGRIGAPVGQGEVAALVLQDDTPAQGWLALTQLQPRTCAVIATTARRPAVGSRGTSPRLRIAEGRPVPPTDHPT